MDVRSETGFLFTEWADLKTHFPSFPAAFSILPSTHHQHTSVFSCLKSEVLSIVLWQGTLRQSYEDCPFSCNQYRMFSYEHQKGCNSQLTCPWALFSHIFFSFFLCRQISAGMKTELTMRFQCYEWGEGLADYICEWPTRFYPPWNTQKEYIVSTTFKSYTWLLISKCYIVNKQG